MEDRCLMCSDKNCINELYENFSSIVECDNSEAKFISCKKTCLEFIVHNSVYKLYDDALINRCFNLIYSHQLNYSFVPNSADYYEYYYDENHLSEPENNYVLVNLARLMIDYPKSISEKADKILLNISREYKYIGDEIPLSQTNARLYCCESDNFEAEIESTFAILAEFGYLKNDNNDQSKYTISGRGWQRINELQIAGQISNQCFIAMSFSEEARNIADIFTRTIEAKCKYRVQLMNRKEHNNQIVPEILFEIRRSKFVVMDVTYPNYGAYYEAGYAEALGKPVIVCCREKEFKSNNRKKRPHFDIAQKSTVVWSDELDLEERLFKRIEATIGINK